MKKNTFALPDVDEKIRKPLLFAENPYDTERLDDLEFHDRRWDASYVPGYSELRAQNELTVRDGGQPVPIPRLQWIRIKRPDGATTVLETDEGMIEWQRHGYRACGHDDLERYGFGWPPAAGSGPDSDGLIRRGDLALFIIDSERADKNRQKRAQQLGEEAEFVPDSKTGEIMPIDDERKDYKGSEIERALKETTPSL